MTNGEVCERCAGGHEYWCVLRNCEQDIFKSAGYALRGGVARQLALFKNNVDIFLVLTRFARQKLIENGFAPERIQILSALADSRAFQPVPVSQPGTYIGFVGRVTPEKGIHQLIEAARSLPYIPFKIAGQYKDNANRLSDVPENVEFLGQLNHEQLQRFYHGARIIVVPSQWYEGLPVVILEAMLSAKPVVCSRLGGLSEVVDDEKTGLLFQHHNVSDLQEKIGFLWNHPSLCQILGSAGRAKAEIEYSPDTFYERLINAYAMSLELRMNQHSASK
jgi:glycosyltransferase involved in cell wall biosynthesis